MNGYNNYYSQNGQSQPQQGQGQYSYSPQGGWEYYDGAWHPARAGSHQNQYGPGSHNNQPPASGGNGAKKSGGGKKCLAAIALVAACALAGFGGGYAANSLSNKGKTVVYQSSQTGVNASATAAGERNAVSDVAAVAGESVVSITTENMVADFFTGGRIVSGAGSGVIISEDGYIITNNHVVSGAQNVSVTLPDGTDHVATVVGTDPATDVAVVKINVEGLKAVVIGDSDSLQVGDFCIAIGNPMGALGGTVTDGIISAMNREINIDGVDMNLLQMSAPVSPGNSGGGLFNARGELVGVVNAKSGSSEAEGLGFAIPANTAIKVAANLIENGYVAGRPALGVSVMQVENEEQAAQAGVSGPGVYISQVTMGSAAAQAGIQVGDRVLAVDGQEVTRTSDLGNAVTEKEVGDELTLTLERNGTQMDITAVLGEKTPTA